MKDISFLPILFVECVDDGSALLRFGCQYSSAREYLYEVLGNSRVVVFEFVVWLMWFPFGRLYTGLFNRGVLSVGLDILCTVIEGHRVLYHSVKMW